MTIDRAKIMNQAWVIVRRFKGNCSTSTILSGRDNHLGRF